jgi:hypothetical protein
MKTFSLLLIMLLVVSQGFSPVFGQKKGKTDPNIAKIDSLTKANAGLTVKLDSVSKDRETYYGVYTTISDRIIKYKFDPAKTSALIDSLQATRDSTLAGLSGLTKSQKDSLKLLLSNNKLLTAKVDSIMKSGGDKAQLITELKQLKELLDAKIITQAEFDSKKQVLMEKWK